MQSQNKIFGDGVIFSHGNPTLFQTQMYQQVHHRQCCFIDSLKHGCSFRENGGQCGHARYPHQAVGKQPSDVTL